MPAISLFGLGIAAKSPVVTAKLMTNFYAEQRPAGEKSMLVAHGTPGLELFAELVDVARGALEFEKTSTAFVVAGAILWEIDRHGAPTYRGGLSTSSGRVSMAHNGVQIMMVDGFNGYIYNTVTLVFAQITDTDFPAGPQTVCYLSRRFVINLLDSSRFYVSDIDDGLSWDALNFANAEANPDPIVAVWASTGQLVLLGAVTTEFWGNSGTLDFPFTALQGSANEWGMDAVASIAKFDNTFAWLVRNRMGQVMVAQMNGYLPKKISTIDIDHIINAYAATSDAVAYSYMLGGHPMYVVSFPSVAPAAGETEGSDEVAPALAASSIGTRTVASITQLYAGTVGVDSYAYEPRRNYAAKRWSQLLWARYTLSGASYASLLNTYSPGHVYDNSYAGGLYLDAPNRDNFQLSQETAPDNRITRIKNSTDEDYILVTGAAFNNALALDGSNNIWRTNASSVAVKITVPNFTTHTCTEAAATGALIYDWLADAGIKAQRIYGMTCTLGPTTLTGVGYVNTSTLAVTQVITQAYDTADAFRPVLGRDENIYTAFPYDGVNAVLNKYDADGALLDTLAIPVIGTHLRIWLYDSDAILWCRGSDAADPWVLVDTVTMAVSDTLANDGYTDIMGEPFAGRPAFYGSNAGLGKIGILPAPELAAVIDGRFDIVYVAPDALGVVKGWILVYVENQDEFWIFVDEAGVEKFRRLDANDLSVKGTITLAGSGPSCAVYDPIFNKVWCVAGDEIFRVDTVTLAEDLRVTQALSMDETYPLTVNPLDGTPWVVTEHDGSGDNFVWKINPTTGAIAASYTVGTAFGAFEASHIITDNDGNAWFLKESNVLCRADVASPGTITTPYSDGTAFDFQLITYDANRNCIWISVPLQDPNSIIPHGNLTWEFRRYNIALDAIDLVIGPPPDIVEMYGLFLFDKTRDFLWREKFYTDPNKLIVLAGADASQDNPGSDEEPTPVNGADPYTFAMNKSGNNVYSMTDEGGVAKIVKYSWVAGDDPDPGPEPGPEPEPEPEPTPGPGGIGGGPVSESWLYDGSTGFWSKLKSFGISRHRVQFSYQLAGMTIGADYANGKQYRITDTALSDNGESIEGEIVGETLAMPDQASLTINKVRVSMETGVGTSTGPGSNPQVSLSVARDAGAKDYGPEMWKPLGATGEVYTRLEWRRLGTTRYFTVKLRITDAVKRVITGASVNASD